MKEKDIKEGEAGQHNYRRAPTVAPPTPALSSRKRRRGEEQENPRASPLSQKEMMGVWDLSQDAHKASRTMIALEQKDMMNTWPARPFVEGYPKKKSRRTSPKASDLPLPRLDHDPASRNSITQEASHPKEISQEVPQDLAQPSQPAVSHRTQNDNEESEWQVRVGNDLPPRWAQVTKINQETNRPNKKRRTEYVSCMLYLISVTFFAGKLQNLVTTILNL